MIEHDCLLYAHRSGDDVMVYRSPIIRDGDDLYTPVLELIGDAALIDRETVTDENMMFGEAEVSVYELAAEAIA